METLELEADAIVETFFENGWTDGLPIVPPRPELVDAMLEGFDPAEVVGALPRRRRSITVQQAAVNTVMAGCRPEYFPIVLAALGALTDPAHNAEAMLTSTGGAASCLVVSGPLAAAV